MSLHTRRAALRAFGLTGIAALAAACSQAAPPSATTPPKPAAVASAPPAPTAPAPTARPAASAAPSQASPQPAAASGTDWNKVVADARAEGRVIVATYAGSAYRKIMDAFEAANPGIKVEQTSFQSSSRDFFPRFFQERKAGLYQWDVIIVPATEAIVQAVPIGAIDPVRQLLRAELLDDKNWVDGFDAGWLDTGKTYSYGFLRSRSQALWVDTNQVTDGEIKSYKDLLNPKWKGKILAGDPRTKGSGFWPATVLRLKTGSDTIITQLFKDQQPNLSTDARQLTELMVRGRFPIGLGAISKQILADFLAQGQGQTLKAVPSVEIDYVNSGNHVLHYANRAPNPNASKVFASWLLSKDGQATYSKEVLDNSRRADVPPFDQTMVPEKGVDYIKIDAAQYVDEILKTQVVAKSVLN